MEGWAYSLEVTPSGGVASCIREVDLASFCAVLRGDLLSTALACSVLIKAAVAGCWRSLS
jgi:hypothetical protein